MATQGGSCIGDKVVGLWVGAETKVMDLVRRGSDGGVPLATFGERVEAIGRYNKSQI